MNSKFSPKFSPIRLSITEKISDTKEYVLEIVKDPVAQMIIAGTLIGATAGVISHKYQAKKASIIPVAISEIHQIYKDNDDKEESVNDLTKMLSLGNDAYMILFKSNNEAIEIGGEFGQLFSSHIYDELTQKNVHYYNLTEIIDSLPKYAKNVRKQLTPYYKAAEFTKNADDAFYGAFTSSHVDKEKWDPIDSAYVYDHTEHDYYYDEYKGEEGAGQLTALFKKIPSLRYDEKVIMPSQTNAEGEYETEHSRKKKGVPQRLSQGELFKLSTSCYTGSTLLLNVKELVTLYPELEQSKNSWNIGKEMAKNASYFKYHYSTSSPSYTDPEEYTIFKETQHITSHADNMLQGIKKSVDLLENIGVHKQELIDILALDGTVSIERASEHLRNIDITKRSRMQTKLAKQLIKDMKNEYQTVFRNGVQVNTYNPLPVILMTLLFGGLAAGATYGVQWYQQKKNNSSQYYDRFSQSFRQG